MDYQVWIKDEYTDGYTKVDCGDLAAAKRRIDQAVREGKEPILTQEVPYEISIKLGELGGEKPKPKRKTPPVEEELKEAYKSEATESETKPD